MEHCIHVSFGPSAKASSYKPSYGLLRAPYQPAHVGPARDEHGANLSHKEPDSNHVRLRLDVVSLDNQLNPENQRPHQNQHANRTQGDSTTPRAKVPWNPTDILLADSSNGNQVKGKYGRVQHE